MSKQEYQTENVACCFCGSSDCRPYLSGVQEFYRDSGEKFNLVKCAGCGLIYTNPRPTRDSIKIFYPDSVAYYSPQETPPLFNNRNSLKQRLLKSILKNHYRYPLPAFLPKLATWPLLFAFRNYINMLHLPSFVPGGRLLDVGCSWGGYLLRMKELGWQVYGVDLNEAAVAYAQSKLGKDRVVQGFIEDAEFGRQFFDVVHMSMCLEHLPDPLATLKQVGRLLKKNGQLIISVPDISGFEAKLYGKRAYTMQVPQHLYHFSPKTIRKIMAAAGFKVKKIVHQNFDRDLVSPSRFLHNKLLRLTALKVFVTLLSLLGKTSRMSVYAEKQDEAGAA